MDKMYFFKKYNIDEERFERLNITWDELMRIYDDYNKRLPNYEDTAKYIAECLNREESIHSIKYRVKDKEHLIEKIIRKMSTDSSLIFTVKNYRQNILDLIGLRALHLFKENWVDVHRFLADNWDFYTVPKANYKKDDPEQILKLYKQYGCSLHEHRHGYRSVHYHLIIRPGRQEQIAEVQVRTLFEEAWSEIDHHFRYSGNKDGHSPEPYLGVLNNITSNADALASYINKLQLNEGIEEEETPEKDLQGITEKKTEKKMEQVLEKDDAAAVVEEKDAAKKSSEESQFKVRDIYKKVQWTNQFVN